MSVCHETQAEWRRIALWGYRRNKYLNCNCYYTSKYKKSTFWTN